MAYLSALHCKVQIPTSEEGTVGTLLLLVPHTNGQSGKCLWCSCSGMSPSTQFRRYPRQNAHWTRSVPPV